MRVEQNALLTVGNVKDTDKIRRYKFQHHPTKTSFEIKIRHISSWPRPLVAWCFLLSDSCTSMRRKLFTLLIRRGPCKAYLRAKKFFPLMSFSLFVFSWENSSNTPERYLSTSRGKRRQLKPCSCAISGIKCHRDKPMKLRITSLKDLHNAGPIWTHIPRSSTCHQPMPARRKVLE